MSVNDDEDSNSEEQGQPSKHRGSFITGDGADDHDHDQLDWCS